VIPLLVKQIRQPVRRTVRQRVRHPATRTGGVAVHLRDKRFAPVVEGEAEGGGIDAPTGPGGGRSHWRGTQGRDHTEDDEQR
jgi:hypothetical protein